MLLNPAYPTKIRIWDDLDQHLGCYNYILNFWLIRVIEVILDFVVYHAFVLHLPVLILPCYGVNSLYAVQGCL